MKGFLAATLSQQIGTYQLLWFKNSNQYVVVDETLYSFIQQFLIAKDYVNFEQSLSSLNFEANQIKSVYNDIDLFLEDCNKLPEEQEIPKLLYSKSFRKLTRYYRVNDLIFEIHFSSEKMEQLIHPQLSHFSIAEIPKKSDYVFDIYIENDMLCLFKDGSNLGVYSKNEYFILQGKFAMELVCSIHENNEMDWMGTFHASAVVKNNQAAMIIGDSGSGKSTFTALLLANNFKVIADDITPILLKDQKVYPYPAGISIKSGAFTVLEKQFSGFDKLQKHYINPYKGYVKYIDPNYNKTINYLEGYPCKTLVIVSYKKDHPTTLEMLSCNEALGILIPESWLAPDKENAQQFLNWIKDVSFYRLTYSDHKDAILKFSALFNS